MRNPACILLFLVTLCGVSACQKLSNDQTGPSISEIQTSGNVLVISDCAGTAVTISAKVTDASGIDKVQLWYRTRPDQKFVSSDMSGQAGKYSVELKGPDFLGRPYGTLEFYITAQDKVGNTSKSPVNQDIQFLPCVNH